MIVTFQGEITPAEGETLMMAIGGSIALEFEADYIRGVKLEFVGLNRFACCRPSGFIRKIT
jgi:hypothetical protein